LRTALAGGTILTDGDPVELAGMLSVKILSLTPLLFEI
jgi:hypothetical protein